MFIVRENASQEYQSWKIHAVLLSGGDALLFEINVVIIIYPFDSAIESLNNPIWS